METFQPSPTSSKINAGEPGCKHILLCIRVNTEYGIILASTRTTYISHLRVDSRVEVE
jgi:hypothetical protein